MGYGIYEGDGAANKLTVSNNTFQYDGKGSKRAMAVLVSKVNAATITGNSVRGETDHNIATVFYLGTSVSRGDRTVTGNTITLGTSATLPTTTYAIYHNVTNETGSGFFTVSNNTIYGGTNAIRFEQ
jgi:hypothetical protein